MTSNQPRRREPMGGGFAAYVIHTLAKRYTIVYRLVNQKNSLVIFFTRF